MAFEYIQQVESFPQCRAGHRKKPCEAVAQKRVDQRACVLETGPRVLETGPRVLETDACILETDASFVAAKEYRNSIFNVTAIPQEGAIWILVFLDLCSSVKSVVKI
jgi:hypothetical protein